jgi:hypothetical protein
LDECSNLEKHYDKAISTVAQLPATSDDFQKLREIILDETYESHIRSVKQAIEKLTKICQFLEEGGFKKWGEA